MSKFPENCEQMTVEKLENDDPMECEDSDICDKVESVFHNGLILNKIFVNLTVVDRKNAKLVCQSFRQELLRNRFLEAEYFTVRGTLNANAVMNGLFFFGEYRRYGVNIKFVDVTFFADEIPEFFNVMGDNFITLIFKDCKINYELLKAVVKYCPNAQHISFTSCEFDDPSGWVPLTSDESEAFNSSIRNLNTEKIKLRFSRNVLGFMYRLIKIFSVIHVCYADKTHAKALVFEWPETDKFFALNVCDDVGTVTLYDASVLDANPEMMPGWSTFHSYNKTTIVDEKSKLTWDTLKEVPKSLNTPKPSVLKNLHHVKMQANDHSPEELPYFSYVREKI